MEDVAGGSERAHFARIQPTKTLGRTHERPRYPIGTTPTTRLYAHRSGPFSVLACLCVRSAGTHGILTRGREDGVKVSWAGSQMDEEGTRLAETATAMRVMAAKSGLGDEKKGAQTERVAARSQRVSYRMVKSVGRLVGKTSNIGSSMFSTPMLMIREEKEASLTVMKVSSARSTRAQLEHCEGEAGPHYSAHALFQAFLSPSNQMGGASQALQGISASLATYPLNSVSLRTRVSRRDTAGKRVFLCGCYGARSEKQRTQGDPKRVVTGSFAR
ncbi:hypothetical protein DFH11DRAFT_1748513 [Phellopilus nigrolimitatus]|nr:hypothetical protein DFH11DRAFT_1748513 [Phellopilus nigrolimitatus]